MSPRTTQLSAESVAAFLAALSDSRQYLLAYSGGMDSHVLLHLLAGLGQEGKCRIRAVHVNHNIQQESRRWADHCRETCRELGVELEVIDVDAGNPGRESPENWAREKRYGALETMLAADEILLSAHHQDDQLETFLLRLLRGAGVLGLAAMRPVRGFGKGLHARPLLQYGRAQLQDYAERHHLRWIEDPSNTDTQLDRNYVRHEVIPAIQRRWPSAALPVSRAIEACTEAQALLDELAQQDLQRCVTEEPDVLSLKPAQALSAPRQKNMIRHWVRSRNLPPPNSRHLSHIVTDVLQARPDARPRVNWKGAALQRQGNYLYLTAS